MADRDGPIDSEVLAFEHMLDEPFYQLVRQQLLAHALERLGAEGASRVRIVHVSPAGNAAYQSSLPRPEHRALGASVSEVWRKLLRHSDRFLSMDSAVFLDPEITSREYTLRYAEDVVNDLPGLLAALKVEDADGIEDALDYEGDEIHIYEDGIVLRIGREGTGYSYPFTLRELYDLANELSTPGV